MDRRALIIGSWLSKGRDKPSPQRIASITDRWSKIFGENRYGFKSLGNNVAPPKPLRNPVRSDLILQIDSAQGITPETELLIYFVGHSVSSGENDINLILSTDSNGNDNFCSLQWPRLFNALY